MSNTLNQNNYLKEKIVLCVVFLNAEKKPISLSDHSSLALQTFFIIKKVCVSLFFFFFFRLQFNLIYVVSGKNKTLLFKTLQLDSNGALPKNCQTGVLPISTSALNWFFCIWYRFCSILIGKYQGKHQSPHS